MKQILEFNGKTLILIGTAHISEQSVQEVRDTLESTQADTIAIELDDERYKAMNETQDWQKMDIVQIIKKKKVGFLFAQMILSSYQRKIAQKLDLKLGEEMNVAIQYANQNDKKL